MSEAVYFRGQDRAHYDYLEPRDVARFKRLDAQDAAMWCRWCTGAGAETF